nr:hypothetical protein [Tanacetum cinerariifolium]
MDEWIMDDLYAMLYVTNVMQICNDTHEYDEARNIDKEEETAKAKERYGWREEVDVCGYGSGEEIGWRSVVKKNLKSSIYLSMPSSPFLKNA